MKVLNVLFSFKTFTLDPERRELRDGSALVAVEPQVFDLILFLLRHRDRVVSRDDLIADVWGGRIVSESTLATRINAARRALGDDGTRQELIKTIARKGVRFVADVNEIADGAAAAPRAMTQAVTFCRTTDSVNLAVGSVGQGPLLLKAANWLNHLEYDWVSPIWSPFYRRLASRFRFVRYDGRGNGLSDREVDDISFDGFVRDIEAVAATLPETPFALLGLSQGAATAIGYAVRHPDRVSRLILYGAYPQGRNKRGDPEDATAAQTLLAMMRQGWGDERSPFMRAFSSIYLPNGTPEQVKWFADMQQATTSGALAARLRTACDDIDVLSLLPQVKVPTLVIHARQDKVAAYEQGRMLAAGIPNATFITLESENHVPLPDEPVWEELVRAIEDFAAG